ncbi:MHS family MFS transporter [Streptomyces sp. NBC_01280]|uniref:MFS transporter n=1 Tax=unclassified Streptomyces TaxID=2593676 RepID=UPI00224D9CB1|nr:MULTISPECIES: MFS transporter [unclassified Streptomyces]MCX5443420.1 MHS family MFS transporter [Streptomyces sp. NBC_00063]WSE12217.1 MHS family MFS transporter [Streptomyces sp. NBC_01397]WSE19412.1 MHS family MFS transporter [Streptomyces sp. NBC_01397]
MGTSTGQTAATRSHRNRAVVASTVGTAIEWYDFFLYGTAAALVFPHLFFPGQSDYTGVLASFATQFVGFAARPVGAAIFGHFGDRVGRKSSLVITLLLMGVSTVLIGCLPTYGSIGLAAPILLVVLRVVQGIGVGGEWGGSVLLAMEWGSKKRRGLMASWPQMGVPLGLLASTGMVRWMTSATGDDFESWGWRIPFLASAVLIAIGLYVRLRVVESPDFSAVKNTQGVVRMPGWDVLRHQWREVLKAAFVRLSEQAPFYLFITFVLSYGTEHLGLARGDLLDDTLVAAAVGLASIPLFGHLSDRIGRRLMYGIGIACVAAFAFPYFALLNTGSAGLVLLAIVLSLVFHDMQYGPQAALIAEGFGTHVRYSGAGLGYQLASVIAGGPAPLIAAAILEDTGSSTGISIYILGCCVLSFVALLLIPRRADSDLTAGKPVRQEAGERPAGT